MMKTFTNALYSMLSTRELENAAILELLNFENFAKLQNPKNSFSKLKEIPDIIPTDMRVFYSSLNPIKVIINWNNSHLTFLSIKDAMKTTECFIKKIKEDKSMFKIFEKHFSNIDKSKMFIFAYNDTKDNVIFSYQHKIYFYKDFTITKLNNNFNSFLYDVIK